MIPFDMSTSELVHSMWVFTAGAILVLVQSLVSEEKRNWWSLLMGCFLGGIGSWVAGQIWSDSSYIYIICGVAAVATEHVLSGVVNASRQFAEKPIKVMTHLARTFLPTFGKDVGSTSNSIDTGDLK